MTAEEMKYEGEILYESIASADAPGYTNREWSYLLTAAQEKVVKDIVDNGLDKEEKYKKAISPLLVPIEIIEDSLIENISAIPKSIRIELDEDTIAVTMERCAVSGHLVVRVKPITHDYYLANIRNPLKKPDSNEVYWRLDELEGDNRVHIIITDLTDITDLLKYKYVAVKKPDPIIVEDSGYVSSDGSIDGVAFTGYTDKESPSTLGTFVHRRIVKEAVNIAFATDKDQIGYQISQNENIKNNK